jgi:hypothetical protein
MKKKIESTIEQTIDKAAEISSKIKQLEKEIEPLKKEIERFVKDNYTDKEILAGVTLMGETGIDRITGAEKREDAKPDAVFEHLDKKGLGDRFLDLCKISVKDMDALIGTEKSHEFRPVVGIQMRQSLSLK